MREMDGSVLVYEGGGIKVRSKGGGGGARAGGGRLVTAKCSW
jgi:hypothetical protein